MGCKMQEDEHCPNERLTTGNESEKEESTFIHTYKIHTTHTLHDIQQPCIEWKD